MSVPTLDMCSLALTGQNHFTQTNVTTNDADVIVGALHSTLLAAGWTLTNTFAPQAYWTSPVSSFPTQSPGTLVPWTYPPSAIAATFVVNGVTKTVYFFDPTKYTPTTPAANTFFVTVASTQSQTSQNYAAVVGTAISGTGSYFFDGAGNVIITATDTSLITISSSNLISGTGFGSAVVWGYHGAFSNGNTHFINGGWELQSGVANGGGAATQYKVQLLRGGPVKTSIVTTLGVTDYSGGFDSSSIYSNFPNGDRVSGGQQEYNIAVVKIIDTYGGYITYELSSGVSGGSYPPWSKFNVLANPYQFMTWADGWVIGGPPAAMVVCAPQQNIGYFVMAGASTMFAASQYPGSHPFPHTSGNAGGRDTPSWGIGMSAALNAPFRTFPPDTGASGSLYQGIGLVGLAMGTPYQIFSSNGLPIIGSAYLVAPPDPASTTQDSVLIGRMWDSGYVPQVYGTLDGPSAPNEPGGGGVPDPSYEQTKIYQSGNWRLYETSVLNQGTLPWQSLWMKVDF